MYVKADFREIEIGKIDRDDMSYVLTPSDPLLDNKQKNNSLPSDAVTRRILLKPPILCPTENSFRLVCGHNLVKEFADAGLGITCGCLVIPRNTAPLNLLSLALEDIAMTRQTSPAEEAICLGKCVQAAGREKAFDFGAEKLSLGRRYSPEAILKILEFNDEQLAALHSGRLELATAFDLLAMSEDDRDIFYSVIAGLRLSTANQRKLVKNCHELGKRQDIPYGEILRSADFSKILRDTSLDLPRKTAQVFTLLKHMLSPQLSKAEDDFQDFLAQLALPKNSEVEHSTSFEQNQLTFKHTFKDKTVFIDKLPKLKEILDRTPSD